MMEEEDRTYPQGLEFAVTHLSDIVKERRMSIFFN